jgi:magnesium-transporting ATPase (P-type)
LGRLVPGDIVLLRKENETPTDCCLVEAFGVRVNDATVTDESLSNIRTAKLSAKEG